MKHSVTLVQRGISSQTHHVSGKSLKLYGTALYSAKDQGVVFRMTLEDYMKHAHDLIGNQFAGQQWVPEFVTDEAKTGVDRCCSPSCHFGPTGGAADATYISVYGGIASLFCETCAPDNATPLFEGAPARKPFAAPQVEAPAPIPQEPIASSDATGSDLPGIQTPEPMPLFPKPMVRRESDAFVDPAEKAAPKVEAPPPVTQTAQVAETVTVPVPTPPPHEPSAQEVVQSMVIMAVGKELRGLEERLGGVIAAAVAHQMKAKTPGLQGRRASKELTEFQQLQKKAKEMGINPFQKSKAVLEAEIDAKNNGAAPPHAPATTVAPTAATIDTDDIEF